MLNIHTITLFNKFGILVEERSPMILPEFCC